LGAEGGQKFLHHLGPAESVPRKGESPTHSKLADTSPHGDWLLSGNNPALPFL
jgi:hypothetical protein